MDEYYYKVAAILKFKYQIEHEVTEAYSPQIDLCEINEYTPRRTAEYLAKQILDLKT